MFAPEHEDGKCRVCIRGADRAIEPCFVDRAVGYEDKAVNSIRIQQRVFEGGNAKPGSRDNGRALGSYSVHEAPQPRPESCNVRRDFGRVDAIDCGNCVDGFWPEWLSQWSSR